MQHILTFRFGHISRLSCRRANRKCLRSVSPAQFYHALRRNTGHSAAARPPANQRAARVTAPRALSDLHRPRRLRAVEAARREDTEPGRDRHNEHCQGMVAMSVCWCTLVVLLNQNLAHPQSLDSRSLDKLPRGKRVNSDVSQTFRVCPLVMFHCGMSRWCHGNDVQMATQYAIALLTLKIYY